MGNWPEGGCDSRSHQYSHGRDRCLPLSLCPCLAAKTCSDKARIQGNIQLLAQWRAILDISDIPLIRIYTVHAPWGSDDRAHTKIEAWKIQVWPEPEGCCKSRACR